MDVNWRQSRNGHLYCHFCWLQKKNTANIFHERTDRSLWSCKEAWWILTQSLEFNFDDWWIDPWHYSKFKETRRALFHGGNKVSFCLCLSMQSYLKSNYNKEDRFIYWQKNCCYWRWRQWCWNDSRSKCWHWYCRKRRQTSIISKWLFNRSVLVCQKTSFVAWKTKLQEKCCVESVRYSQRTNHCNHSSYLQYYLLLRGHSYLQWLSYFRILLDLYDVPCIFTCDWWRLLRICCVKVSNSLLYFAKGKGSQH